VISLGFVADLVTIVTAGSAFLLYGKAARGARANVAAHLELVALWCNGGAGWRAEQITLDTQLAWLNPTQTIFPLVSGPALIQMTLGDKVTLGSETIRAVVHLNQAIESFNAVLNKAETLRTDHAVALVGFRERAERRTREARAAGREPRLAEVLGPGDNDDRDAAATLIAMLTMLHTGLIGVPGGNGLCEDYRAALAAFDEGRPI
jgi:hypothetical protein